MAAGVRRVVQSQEGGRAWQRRQVCFACEKKGGGAVGCTCGCCGAARAQRMYSVGSGARSRHAACSSLCGNGWRGGLARHAGSAQLPAAVKRIVVSGGRWLCMCRQRRVLSQVRCYWCVPPGLHRRLVSWRVTRKKQLAGAALYVWGRRRRRSALGAQLRPLCSWSAASLGRSGRRGALGAQLRPVVCVLQVFECRVVVIERVGARGGHVGPNEIVEQPAWQKGFVHVLRVSCRRQASNAHSNAAQNKRPAVHIRLDVTKCT